MREEEEKSKECLVQKGGDRREKKQERLGEKEGGRDRERVAVLNWDRDKTSERGCRSPGPPSLSTASPALPAPMLPGIKQEVYQG